jgi:hypothetical protein
MLSWGTNQIELLELLGAEKRAFPASSPCPAQRDQEQAGKEESLEPIPFGSEMVQVTVF